MLDEHCDPAIAAGLRLHGVVFTQDRDFLRHHAAGSSTAVLRSAISRAAASGRLSRAYSSSGKSTSPWRWPITSSTS